MMSALELDGEAFRREINFFYPFESSKVELRLRLIFASLFLLFFFFVSKGDEDLKSGEGRR